MIWTRSRDRSGEPSCDDIECKAGLLIESRYMCRDPKEIKFAPLNRDTEHTAEELMTIFEVSCLARVGDWCG